MGCNNDQKKHMSRVVASVNMMIVAVFLGEDNREAIGVYRVIATSAYEAARLMSDYLGTRDPWMRIDVTETTSDGVEGPPRVIGPFGEGGFDRRSTPKH
jgi:hypothetical protein